MIERLDKRKNDYGKLFMKYANSMTFFRLPFVRQRLLIEAIANTALAWCMIKCLPYSIWRIWLGPQVDLSTLPDTLHLPDRKAYPSLADIHWAHARLRKHFRPSFTCLMLGFSARAMLRRRRVNSVLVLGVSRKCANQKGGLRAHAWVIQGQNDIVGGANRLDYIAVSAHGVSKSEKNAEDSCNRTG